MGKKGLFGGGLPCYIVSKRSHIKGFGGADVSRGADTRERIVTEARRLFAEKGFDGATMAQIAHAARLTEGAIYRHFDDKKDLFMACVVPVVEEAFARSLELVHGATSVEELARALVSLRLRIIEEHLDSFDILFTEAPYHPELKVLLYERIKAQIADVAPALARAQEAGFLRRRPNLLILGLGLTVAMWAMVKLRRAQGELEEIFGAPLTAGSLTDDFVEFVLYGVAGEPAGGKE